MGEYYDKQMADLERAERSRLNEEWFGDEDDDDEDDDEHGGEG